ncbi:MAG: GNAT family N-acetyltransferase [Myxococcales bacterium]|nr:GNAT family N-acetyltransferase [Myxococcales bacterium]
MEGFFVGWPNPPSTAVHLKVLCNSQYVVLAALADTGRVVGFMTAISDGALSAYIPLLEVLPSHRGRGIGSELTHRMLESLKHMYMVDLLCAPDVQPFYEQFKLRKAHGMMIRNYDRQSGE